MGVIEDTLKRYNINPDEPLSAAEMDDFYKLIEVTQAKAVTLQTYKTFIRNCITVVERELVDTPEFERYCGGLFTKENRNHLTLKARLKNYLFLESFLTQPERAKAALDAAAERLGGRNGKTS